MERFLFYQQQQKQNRLIMTISLSVCIWSDTITLTSTELKNTNNRPNEKQNKNTSNESEITNHILWLLHIYILGLLLVDTHAHTRSLSFSVRYNQYVLYFLVFSFPFQINNLYCSTCPESQRCEQKTATIPPRRHQSMVRLILFWKKCLIMKNELDRRCASVCICAHGGEEQVSQTRHQSINQPTTI